MQSFTREGTLYRGLGVRVQVADVLHPFWDVLVAGFLLHAHVFQDDVQAFASELQSIPGDVYQTFRFIWLSAQLHALS